MTSPPSSNAPRRSVKPARLLLAALLGLAAALLVACGGSTKGLIPAADAGPLQNDFETVQQAAENASGNCSTTEAALLKTSEDLTALPTSVDAGLRNNLRQGVANLRSRALALCAQPLPQTTATNETPKPTTTATTPTTPTTTPTTTTPTTTTPTTTTPTTTNPGGGTVAPGTGETPPNAGSEPGGGGGENGSGNRAGGAGPGEGGGQEGGK